MKIVLASRNAKKIRELETLLAQHSSMHIEVLSLDDIGYTEEIVEDGTSFEENAWIKAATPAAMGYIGIADDSGLSVDALGGAPGIYSARYGGEGTNDAKNNEKLLAEMNEVPDEGRGAAFVSAVACVFPRECDVEIPEEVRTEKNGLSGFVVRGECRGTILRETRGCDGFGYDPLFYVSEKGCTFAELSSEEKNAISHRGVAMRTFCRQFLSLFEN
ncbi:MAG: RdgB/HAM1 family non-canonical purine NTP pyrophosphatase [Clostridia bacterium]|nr:RdgB/HAM1 family non-canonical purine NTP pyrophosphatase [Clostridia bacterium]